MNNKTIDMIMIIVLCFVIKYVAVISELNKKNIEP